MNDNMDDLVREATVILERSRMLRASAEWLHLEIDKHCKDTDEAKAVDMDWEEKEAAFRKFKELEGRLLVSLRDLKKLDEDFNLIAEKVNRGYGRTLMEPIPPFDIKAYLDKIREENPDDQDPSEEA